MRGLFCRFRAWVAIEGRQTRFWCVYTPERLTGGYNSRMRLGGCFLWLCSGYPFFHYSDAGRTIDFARLPVPNNRPLSNMLLSRCLYENGAAIDSPGADGVYP